MVTEKTTNPAAEQSLGILNSWKEIAVCLDRGIRTVQRWEQELHLPVHRIGKGKRAPVYAAVSDLKFWMVTSAADTRPRKSRKQIPPPPRVFGNANCSWQQGFMNSLTL